jgi:hypothetical protein
MMAMCRSDSVSDGGRKNLGFHLIWCSSENRRGCARLSQVARWEGNTWVVRDTMRENGQDIEFKEVFSEITPTSFTQTLYQGPSDRLVRVQTAKATRVQ